MEDSGKLLGALLIGTVIGGIAGLLLAPDKGSETRKKLADAGKDLTDKLKDQALNLKSKVNRFGEMAEDEMNKSKSNFEQQSSMSSN